MNRIQANDDVQVLNTRNLAVKLIDGFGQAD
jgi:hypothetical protein